VQLLAGAASVTAVSVTVGMIFSAHLAAIEFAVFLDCIGGGNHAKARLTGTFHLSYGRHFSYLSLTLILDT
jgi:hypothetical protein